MTRLRPGARGLVTVALATVTALAGPASAATAAGSEPTFVLSSAGKPGALRLNAVPGASVRGAVTLRNTTARPIVVRLQPADIRNAANGNADYVTAGKTAAGRWVHLATRSVALKPRDTRRVNFRIDVPEHASAASHYAGIVAADAGDQSRRAATKTSTQGSTFSFGRINRQALPVTLRLPGRSWHRLKLGAVKLQVAPAGAGLTLAVRPQGTVLTPAAPIDLRVTRGGETIFRHSAALGQLFPSSLLRYRVPWPDQPAAGTYRVTGTIRPAGAQALRIDRTVVFTPAAVKEQGRVAPPAGAANPSTVIPTWIWLALAACLTLLLALAGTVIRLQRRNRAPSITTPQ